MTKSRIFKTAVAAAACSMLFTACGDDSSSSNDSNGSGEIVSISDKAISGVSQKGPFVTGSSVKVFELDENFKQTGKSFTGKIEKDDGAFAIESVELASQYAVLEASGYYRNEVTGKKSAGTITLNAITDLSDREKVNVNLLTHLEYDRAMYLVKHDTMGVVEAKAQAEKEIFKAFGIEGDFGNSEDLDIFSKGEGNAALLAISVLMQGDKSEAELTEFLTKFAGDIKEDGTWDDSTAMVELADWALLAETSGILDSISKNIASWELGEVPEFAGYIYKYWTGIYELKACEKDAEGTVLEIENKSSKNADSDVRLICKDAKWTTASDLEKDTYGWKAPEGKSEMDIVKNGEITGANYVYDFKKKMWRELNFIEFPKTGVVDSTTVPEHFIISTGDYKNVNSCYDLNQGEVTYVAKKQAGGFFCKRIYSGVGGKWTSTTEQPEFSKELGLFGSIFEENYDNLIFCNLEMYVCDDYEWKLTTDTVGIQVPYGPEDEAYRIDGELYFASKSLLWFKYDAKQGWGLASWSDVQMYKLQKDEVEVVVPGWYRWNPEKKDNDHAFSNELEGSPADDGWEIDFGPYAYHGSMTQPGCTIERKGEIVYIKNKEPYQWIKNFQICNVNPLIVVNGVGSDTMWGEWGNIDHWSDNKNAKCDKDNLGKRRYGTISKMIEYECVEAKNATYSSFSGEETSFVDGYAWTAIGFVGQEMIDMDGVPCTAENVGDEYRGTYSNYWLYTCTEIDTYNPPYFWVKSEKQDTFLVDDYGYGWN